MADSCGIGVVGNQQQATKSECLMVDKERQTTIRPALTVTYKGYGERYLGAAFEQPKQQMSSASNLLTLIP